MSWTREEYAKRTKRTLAANHHKMLIDSVISLEVAVARGYYTAYTPTELRRIGFPNRPTPALVVPVHDVHGEVATTQIRPDTPPVGRDGKITKYLTKRGAHMVLDVPPTVREHLAQPDIPLLITEGARKADAAASVGLACIALMGVSSWRGRNDVGGTTVLSDWEHVHLKQRTVVLCFDSDVTVKATVYQALVRLRSWLQSRGAEVYVAYLPMGEHGEKMGLDDWLAAGHEKQELSQLLAGELRPPPPGQAETEDVPVGLRSVGTGEDTTWFLRFDRGEVRLTTRELLSWPDIVARCLEQYNWEPAWSPSKAEWTAVRRELVTAAPREEGIAGLSRRDQIADAVRRALDRAKGDPEMVSRGGVWFNADENAYVLKTNVALGECRSIWPTVKPGELRDVIMTMFAGTDGHRRVAGKTERALWIPAEKHPREG